MIFFQSTIFINPLTNQITMKTRQVTIDVSQAKWLSSAIRYRYKDYQKRLAWLLKKKNEIRNQYYEQKAADTLILAAGRPLADLSGRSGLLLRQMRSLQRKADYVEERGKQLLSLHIMLSEITDSMVAEEAAAGEGTGNGGAMVIGTEDGKGGAA